jgi:catechol 2,3-dioxygenase-like lactoylglutathione lyase family enzyme
MRPGLSFSHFGMFVNNLARMEAFYADALEFTVTDRGELPGPQGPMDLVFLSRDPDEHHQIVLISGRPEVLPFNPINQISLRADSLTTLRRMLQRLPSAGCTDAVTVTHGNAVSIYARDPEGNRLELFIDLPWYVTQPQRVPVDFALEDAELMAWLEMHARSQPGFMPRDQWRAAMARKMGLSESG